MSQQISKNIFWLSLSRVLALVLLFFAYTKLFRYLGPFGSGQYQFVLSYVLIFSTIVDFGIQQLITKKISEEPEKTKIYFQNFLAFELLASFFLFFLLLAIAYFRHYEPAVFYAIFVAGLGMVANAMTYPYLAVMAAFQDMKKVALINFLNSAVNISIIFSAVIFHKYIVYLASVQVLFGILDLILYRFFVRKHLPNPEALKAAFRFDVNLIKQILRQGWPFAVLVGFSAIYNRIDVVIITAIKGYHETGYYTAAYKIFDLLGFFPSVVSYTLFPFFSSLMAKGAIVEVRLNLEKYLRLMIAAALPMAVGGTILAKYLILLMTNFDQRFLPAVPVMAILIWAPAILFIYIPVNALVISQLTKKAVLVTGLNVFVNIVGNLILVPRFGIKAAAVMTVISEGFQCIFYFYFVKKNITDFSFIRAAIKPLVATFIMGLVLWTLRECSFVILLPLGACTYLAGLILLKFFSKSDWAFIKGLLVPSGEGV